MAKKNNFSTHSRLLLEELIYFSEEFLQDVDDLRKKWGLSITAYDICSKIQNLPRDKRYAKAVEELDSFSKGLAVKQAQFIADTITLTNKYQLSLSYNLPISLYLITNCTFGARRNFLITTKDSKKGKLFTISFNDRVTLREFLGGWPEIEERQEQFFGKKGRRSFNRKIFERDKEYSAIQEALCDPNLGKDKEIMEWLQDKKGDFLDNATNSVLYKERALEKAVKESVRRRIKHLKKRHHN